MQLLMNDPNNVARKITISLEIDIFVTTAIGIQNTIEIINANM